MQQDNRLTRARSVTVRGLAYESGLLDALDAQLHAVSWLSRWNCMTLGFLLVRRVSAPEGVDDGAK